MEKKKLLFTLILLFSNSVSALDINEFSKFDNNVLAWAKNLTQKANVSSTKHWVKDIQKIPDKLQVGENKVPKAAELYIFATLSMPNLKALLQDAQKYGGIVTIRGLKNNSMKETVSELLKITKLDSEGVMIDPLLFKEYQISRVPAFVLVQDNTYDKIAGNFSTRYALEKIASLGDLKAQANELLKKK